MRPHQAVLDWYEPRRAAYPWRKRPTPYRVLVSEVMLQQTQAGRVEPIFRAFMRRFPSLRKLAEASRADVIRAWAGLGYNRRAVMLHEAARTVVREHGGRIPRDPEVLRRLPGVGPYTAAAVASIAHGEPVAAVDVNIGRVVARYHLGAEVHEEKPAKVRELAEEWLDRDRPGDWNQALMDLGRSFCRPKPRCGVCPLASGCAFRRSGRKPTPAPRRQSTFEGSTRQVRGAILAALRVRKIATLAGLSSSTGHDLSRVATTVATLAHEGSVLAGPVALAGGARGRVELGGLRLRSSAGGATLRHLWDR